MATTTTYSTKISTPVLVGWKCEICGVRNANIGEIRFTSEASTSSIRSSKHAKAQEEAENYAKTHWFENAYSIISDPNANGERMYETLILDKPRCENCLKKPRWYDPKTYLRFMLIAELVAIISFFCGILAGFIGWLVFVASIGYIAWSLYRKSEYSEMMKKLPKEYTPVFGSLSKEFDECVSAHGLTIDSDEISPYIRIAVARYSDEIIKSLQTNDKN